MSGEGIVKSKYLFVVLLLGCLLIISSCSGNNNQDNIIVEEEESSSDVSSHAAKTIVEADIQQEEPNPAENTPDKKPSEFPHDSYDENAICIDDFDAGSKPNCLGGDLGAFDYMPNDFSQSCLEAYDPAIKVGDSGFSMRLDYDVDSTNPAFNGFWMKLNGFNANNYKMISFWVKGDAETGFTNAFKVELKNNIGETGKYYVNGISGNWQKIEIPLKDFAYINDFSELSEFVIVFEDRIADPKEGTIWLDDIYFIK
jgi:hypothetical protein